MISARRAVKRAVNTEDRGKTEMFQARALDLTCDDATHSVVFFAFRYAIIRLSPGIPEGRRHQESFALDI